MIWYAAIAVLITVVSVWYLARPLARQVVQDGAEQRDQLQQLRERLLAQLNELDVEVGDRNIDVDVANDERHRLETELARALHELKTLEKPEKNKKGKKTAVTVVKESSRVWVIGLIALGLGMPLISAGLYYLHQRQVLTYLFSPAPPADTSVPPQVLEMVARLEKRLEGQPNDAAGWFRLGRAYAVLGRQEAAATAYAHAYDLTPDDPQLIAEYAAFLYNIDPQKTDGQVFTLYSKLLQLEPENQDALWFNGFVAFQKGDYKQSLKLWEKLLKALPADSKEADHLRMILGKTREKMGKK
jgi:cytochrome c-type biogenesis protein CcmH/NrfG